MMVPLATYTAESYLACIRGISPEYRTTGDFRDTLRGFAQKLDDLAQAMRERVLARTIYKREHFAPPWLVPFYEVTPASGAFLEGGPPTISPTCNRWPVGAIDLRYHDNLYFADFLAQLHTSEFHGFPAKTKLGVLNIRWIPPAILEPDAYGNYKITNPDECAAAANAQSELDYADLLAVSGYPELLQLAALYRNEATEPPTSQTVQGQKPFYRNALPSTTVMIESNPVHFTGEVIKSTALREPQQCVDWVESGPSRSSGRGPSNTRFACARWPLANPRTAGASLHTATTSASPTRPIPPIRAFCDWSFPRPRWPATARTCSRRGSGSRARGTSPSTRRAPSR